MNWLVAMLEVHHSHSCLCFAMLIMYPFVLFQQEKKVKNLSLKVCVS